MRTRLVLAISLLTVLLLGVGVAIYLASREPSRGKLDTDLDDVTLVAPKPRRIPAPPKPPPAPRTDKRCWQMFGGNPQRSLARLEIHLGIPRKRPLWSRGLKGYIEFPPAYCDGVLYVNTVRGDTWAIEAKDGRVLWRRRSRAQKPSSPAIAGQNVIVTAKTDGTVTALDRYTGRIAWQVRTHARVESSPAIQDGVVYFGASDGRLFAVNATTGRIRWAYDTGGRINSSPSLMGNRVCITTYAGSIFCLRRRDGRRQWSTFVRRDAFRYESFYASASSDGKRLFTVARSGKIVALSASTGRILWTRRVYSLGYSTPAVARDRIFVGGFDGALHAYRKTDGRELWRARVGGRILGAPVVIGKLVFFSTLERKTYAARISDGRVVWRLHMGKYSPGIATERAYYFTLNGILLALRGRYSPR